MLFSAFSYIARLWRMVACEVGAGLRALRGRMRGTGAGRGAALALVGAVLCFAPQGLHAQSVNLLSNPGFEQPGCNDGFYCEYLCWPPVDPGPGYFTASNSPAAWNALFNNCPVDHTSGSGRMLILDGDTHRVAWAETLYDLEAYKTYRFRFWAMNLYNANPAVLRVSFRPEPNWQYTQVPPSFQVQIAGCSWQMAEFYWTCNPSFWGAGQPRNMTVIVDNTTSGTTGADFALDDMDFRMECSGAAVITSGPPPAVVVGFGGSTAITVGFLSNSNTPLALPLPPGYRLDWRHNGVAVASGAATLTPTGLNAYTTTLYLSNVRTADVGLYTCTITTPCGAVTSNASSLRLIGHAR